VPIAWIGTSGIEEAYLQEMQDAGVEFRRYNVSAPHQGKPRASHMNGRGFACRSTSGCSPTTGSEKRR
jgi:hypothetical protein